MSPRTNCPPDHAHDQTDTCYNTHRCACDPCRARNAANHRRLRRLRAYGLPTSSFVDAAPVREHIAHLREFGIGARQIGRLSGYEAARVGFVIWGRASRKNGHHRPATPPSQIQGDFAAAILAVKPDIEVLSPRTYIPARGTRRRIQALIANGWTIVELTERLGIRANRLSFVLYHQDRVTVATHRAIAELFDELWATKPPENDTNWHIRSRARKHAAARGWQPALAWDDIDNDPTPPAPGTEDGVDEIAVDLAIEGEPGIRLTRAERHKVLRHFHALHWSDGMIADRVGVDDRTILRDREELGLEAFDQTDLIRRDAA